MKKKPLTPKERLEHKQESNRKYMREYRRKFKLVVEMIKRGEIRL